MPEMMHDDLCPGRRAEDLFYRFAWLNRIEEYPHPELMTSEQQEHRAEQSRRKGTVRFDDQEESENNPRKNFKTQRKGKDEGSGEGEGSGCS